MSEGTLLLDTPSATAGILATASPSDEARALVSDDQTPRALLDRLVEKELFPDAVKVLALAFPKREAVWWACRCCRASILEADPPEALAALEAAERWASEPTEPNRRSAQDAAEAAGLEAPAGCAAMGAFFSGGSLAPPGVPDVPPADHLTAHVVAGAVMLSAVRAEPEKAPEKFRTFLALGLAVADGADRLPVSESSQAEARGKPEAGGESSTGAPASSTPRTTRWDDWE